MVDTEAVQDRPTRFSKQNLLNSSYNRVFEITAAPFSSSDLLSVDKPQPSLDSEQVATTK